jgi:hypothetical protein
MIAALSGPETSIQGYSEWYSAELGFDRPRDEPSYDASSAVIRDRLATTEFWGRLSSLLPEFADEYELRTTYPLFVLDPRGMSDPRPALVVKPFESLLEKTWRKNVLENARWPKAPIGGWLKPDDWYSKVGDIVRTTIAVKYLDGVADLKSQLEALASASGIACNAELAARHEGYYAGHLDLTFDVELPPAPGEWDTSKVRARAEIQITTQLQEVIRRLLHRQYESDRVRTSPKDWEWDFAGEAFGVNYLGHVLHYLEGKIMDERERLPNAS